MPQYGEAPTGPALAAQFAARRNGKYEFELFPELWATPEVGEFYDGKQWQCFEFKPDVPDNLPATSGIYMFVAKPLCGRLRDHTYILYIGKTTNLRTRYGDYLKEKRCEVDAPREKVVRFLNHLEDFLFFYCTQIPGDQLDHAEGLLKDNITPYGNTQVVVIGRLNASQPA